MRQHGPFVVALRKSQAAVFVKRGMSAISPTEASTILVPHRIDSIPDCLPASNVGVDGKVTQAKIERGKSATIVV
jgi:hypothetical protein